MPAEQPRLRILVLTRALPGHPGSGGMEKIAWDLMCAWQAAGHEVICATTPGGLAPAEPGGGNDPQAPTITELPGRPGAYSPAWFAATRELAARIAPDAVLGVSAGAHGIVTARGGLRARGGGRVPIIMQAHGTSLNEIRSALGARSLRGCARAVRQLRGLAADLRRYRRYDALVAIGANVAAGITELPRIVRPPVLRIIPNGVPAAAASSAGEPDSCSPGRRGIVFVGRMLPEKGPQVACRVAESLGEPLTLIGAGPLSDELAAAHPQVQVTGRLEPAAIAEHLQRAAVLIAPSQRREGLPLVVLEALANGCPAVITPQTAEAFPAPGPPPGVHVAASASAADFSAAVTAVLADPSPAPVCLPEEFTLDAAAGRYIDLFCEMREHHGFTAQ